MIKININKHQQTADALEKLYKTLKLEKETQSNIIENVNNVWKGSAPALFCTSLDLTLKGGLYYKVMNTASKVYTTMDNALPKLKKQKAVCNSFPNCLRGESIVYDGSAMGTLMLEVNNLQGIYSTCDLIANTSKSVKGEMEGVIDGVSDLVDFGNCRELVQSACDKICRVTTLKNAIQKYAFEVGSISLGLSEDYKASYDKKLLEQVPKYYFGVKTYDEKIKCVEEVFELDQYMLTEKDITFLTNTLDEAFKNHDEKMIQKILEKLMKGDYPEAQKEDHIFHKDIILSYEVSADQNMIAKMLDELEKQGKKGETYYTLLRLSNYVDSDQKTGRFLDENDKLNRDFKVEVSVIDGKTVIDISIVDADNQKVKSKHRITAMDLEKEIVLSDDMRKLGFTEEYVERLRTMTCLDGDVEIAKYLAQHDYEKAFEVDLSICSACAGNNIVDYIMYLDQAGNVEEQQKLINMLLYNDTKNCSNYSHLLGSGYSTHEEYIELIIETLDKRSEAIKGLALALQQNGVADSDLNEIYAMESELFRQAGLYQALLKLYQCDFQDYDDLNNTMIGIQMVSMRDGYAYFQVSDLSMGANEESAINFSITTMGYDLDSNGNQTLIDAWDGAKLDIEIAYAEGVEIALADQDKIIKDSTIAINNYGYTVAYDTAIFAIEQAGIPMSTIIDTANNIEGVMDGNKKSGVDLVGNTFSYPYDKMIIGVKNNLPGADDENTALDKKISTHHKRISKVGGKVTKEISKYLQYQQNRQKAYDKESTLLFGKEATITITYAPPAGEDAGDMKPLENDVIKTEKTTAVSAVRREIMGNGDNIEEYYKDKYGNDQMAKEAAEQFWSEHAKLKEMQENLDPDNVHDVERFIRELDKTNEFTQPSIIEWMQGNDLYK